MVYIPKDWIVNKTNEYLIHEIIDEHLFTDLYVNDNIETVIQKLEEIGETIMVEKIKDGTLTFY